MVLDDEVDTAKTFEIALKSGGYGVTTFTSSDNALQYLARHPTQFDLVISDIKMPLIDGIEFARRVKTQLPSLRIVLVTAFELDRSESASIESLGVREVIRKPLRMPQLLAIVAKHSRKADEILDRIYCCQQCEAKFLFSSDVTEHKEMSGHLNFNEVAFT
jgi:CheY-like chemotaxis protein